MSGRRGSSNLTVEQGEWFVGRYGIRYVAVQTDATVPSRRQRRAARRAQGRKGR